MRLYAIGKAIYFCEIFKCYAFHQCDNIWHTIKPGMPEHRTPAEQRNTPEQWRNTLEQRNHTKRRNIVVFFKENLTFTLIDLTLSTQG